jgi:CRISPR/Cas system-associated endoribonuclease Cas2
MCGGVVQTDVLTKRDNVLKKIQTPMDERVQRSMFNVQRSTRSRHQYSTHSI